MSPKIFRKISLPDLEISLDGHIFSKEVSQLTDCQTYKKFKTIWMYCKNIPGKTLKNSERHLIQS